MQLQGAGAGFDHLDERLGIGGIALAEEAEIDRDALGGLQHALQMPGPGASRRQGTRGRTAATAQHGGDAAIERVLGLLRGDEMNMAVDAAGGDDLALAADDLGAGADDDVDAGLDVRVAGLADAGDATTGDADIGLDDAGMVDDHCIGDDGVGGAVGAAGLALPHAVADHLAAAVSTKSSVSARRMRSPTVGPNIAA